MKLLSAAPSPFARKARVTILEAGLQDAVEIVGVAARPDEPDPTLIARNPLGKIPCLVLDDGTPLFDSRAISRCLDAQSDLCLYPDGDWNTLTVESTGDGIMDSAVAMVYEKRFRAPEMISTDFLGWQWAKIARALDFIEDSQIGFLSEGLTAAHISVGCALGYLDFRHPDRDWRNGRKNLADWEATFRTRPSMAATTPSN